MDSWNQRFILVFLTMLGSADAQTTVCRETAIADLVFLVDGSWSIGTKNFKSIQDFLYTMVDGLDIGPDKIQVGLIQYSDLPHNEFFLNTFHHKEDILTRIQNLHYKGGGTKTGKSLKFMLDQQFNEAAGSRHREGVPQVAVVITDGEAQDDIREPAKMVKDAGITLYALGIKDAALSELQLIASDPDETHVYNVEDFAGLQGISPYLLQVICTTVEEASQHITQISPVCQKATMADIVFLVDSSTSVGEENFEKVKSFLYTMISSLDIGPSQVRIGLAQYSDTPYKEFLLNQYSSKSDILEQIQNLPFRKGGTNTGAALDFVREEYFTESAGSRARENSPQVAILLTDGDSNDEVKVPAGKLRARGISVYVVGIGAQNTTELKEIASRPLNKFLFRINRFDILEELSGRLLQTMCFAVESQIKAFTKHYADMVFLIDSSDAMGAPNFEAVKRFTTQIVEQLDVGADKHQIGFAQYSGEGKREFLLNTYESKEEVLNHIQNRIEFMGGPLQTGAALQFLQEVFFTKEAGSRFNQGIPQFTVVVTSAKSEDDVKESAKQLKETGVKIATIGILDSDREEMKEMATDALVYQADDVWSLDEVQQTVVDILDVSVHWHYDDALDIDVPAVCYSASVADIAFLVDESSRLGQRNFQLIRAFLLKIIRALDIAPDNVRVALVLYSDEPRLEFGLNAFRDKSEVVNYVKTLPYRGGESYTGAAINFLRENVFTKRAGSRKAEGVQQLAVVITDGQSVDNFTEPASKLRRSGITVYAVGIQNGSESGPLHKIASHPPRKHVSNVESLLELSNIEWKIKKRICTDIVSHAFSIPVRSRTLKEGCEETEEGDIYFLIDGSGSISWENFHDMKTFMNEMIGMFQVGADKVRFGVVQYGSSPQTEFEITQYNSEAQLKEAIKNIKQIGGGTNTGYALRDMQHLFKISARSNIPQFLIVITDGQSQDQVTKAAEELRQQGIVIYAIGVRDAIQEELEDIAGSKDRMFFVNDFDSLKLIKHDIAQDICSPEVCRQLLADIILLIDSSESMDDDQFAKTKEFIHLIVNGSDVGADKVQIGVLQFSSNLKKEFLLNEHHNKTDLRSAINQMKQIKEGTNTGNALKRTLEYFDTPKGGRPGIKQHLIVVTDGKSNDEVEIPARTLRDKGITIYAIGVIKANDTQLLEIAGAQERVFSEDSFESLLFLDKTILFEICNAKQECKRTEVADILFVVHGSRGTTELQFQATLQLMEAIVNSTVVGKDNVQFGAIVYGTVPEEQFPLAQYSTKNQVREAISKLRPLGQPAFTARALNFARQRFDAAYGGRATSLGITQIIVLITDEPTAPTDQRHLLSAVQALRQEGIRVIAIGIDAASRTELKEIVGDKGRWFYTSSYSALGRFHENITSEICDGSKPACGTEEADLVFLIDGSGSISSRNFSTMKTFMKEIVDSFIIARDKVRIGVAQYSKNPQKEFYLNEFDTNVAIKGKIDNITQLKTSTYTGKGLRFVKSFFEPVNGGRKNRDVLQSLIVITDGKSNDSVDEAAAALRNEGIHIFAIGIGTTNSFELVRIAGDARRVFVVQNFEVLQTIERKIVKEVCKPGDLPRRDCNIDISVGVDFSEPAGPASALPVKQRMRTYLPGLLQRMGSVINISCVTESPVNIRFRYQVFSGSGQALFDSNFEAYNDEIVQKFLAVQTTVETYLNAGFLQSIWDRSLSLASARVKVLLVFSDGPDDSIEVLKTTADGLRRKGLNALLTVGLGNFQEFNELQKIEFGRGFEYMEPLIIGNPELPSRLWRALDTLTERECCNVCCKCFGEDGIRGAPGTSGIKGREGYRGHPGHPGEEGGQGDRGLMGITGKRGERGCTGTRGQKGPRGFRGDKGENGDSGLDGIDGQEGDRGIPGSHGQKGSSGRRGRKGPRGEAGEPGELGVRGDNGVPGMDNNASGSAGVKGITGRQGELGTDGVPGEPGEKGANGAIGRRGRPGLEGLKGSEGDPGLPGEIGLQGNQGTPGLRGIPGPRGLQGFPGPQGGQGIDGAPGSIGKEGPRGQKGEQGDLGEKGLQGLPGPRGLTGQDGDNGYGIRGRKGAKGHAGFPGNPGLQGEDGDPGVPGDKGAKGIQGQRGRGGTPGAVGDPGRWGEPGRMGQKGQKGERAMTPCELVNFTRGNCPCCIGVNKCPVYPTEVAFALDMSGDVTPESFDRMKDITLSLLKGIEISRSNCPTGARVSVLSYNTNTKYLIRFSDFQRKELLMEAIQRIPLEKSSSRRNIGRAMRFVARNAFKRHRQGTLMRNVAVFLTAGPSQDATSINTAVLEFSALDITPVVIALREVPNVRQAFSADDTHRFQLFVWENKEDENLNTVSRCALCFDKCNPAPECQVMDSPPVVINMDITYILDSSRNVGSEDFETMKTFVSNMLDTFVVASLPMESDRGARVALVQQAPQNFTVGGFSEPAKKEFELVSYDNKNLMQMHIEESVHQLEGPSAVGHALDWTISNVFLEAPNPRKHRVIFTILGSQTSSWDREKLRKMSLEAKCQGFTMLTLALGNKVDDMEMMELSSAPVEQHLLALGRTGKLELPYALQFSRAFLNLLKREINPYPPPGLQEECETLDRGDTYQELKRRTDSIIFPEIVDKEALQPSTSLKGNMQEEIMAATQEPIKYTEGKKLYDDSAGIGVQDACLVDMDNGECDNYTLKWYFDKKLHICTQFWYGGCGGNTNRFETREECEALCIKSL